MSGFNPYLIGEVVTQTEPCSNFFGLIDDTRTNEPELFGYEVTLSGSIVIPELHPRSDNETQKIGTINLC